MTKSTRSIFFLAIIAGAFLLLMSKMRKGISYTPAVDDTQQTPVNPDLSAVGEIVGGLGSILGSIFGFLKKDKAQNSQVVQDMEYDSDDDFYYV